MILAKSDFFASVEAWLYSERTIESAVLYGSSAYIKPDEHRADDWSDVDLHVVAEVPMKVYKLDWASALPMQRLCLHIRQPATGGTNKITVLFVDGQIDLVVVSKMQMRLARWAMRLRLHRRVGFIRTALNEMATSMRTGYRFLKGAEEWGDVYERVVNDMIGVRLQDSAVRELADTFLINMMLALKRLDRGELVAVQYWLHRHLIETNLRLLRELQLRRGLPLPSFGLGRRVETLLSATELSWVQVSARLERNELLCAIKSSFDGMRSLTGQLVHDWRAPATFDDLFVPYALRRTDSLPSRLRTE